MSIKIQINGVDNLISNIEISQQRLVSALVDKMTEMMQKLEAKIVSEKLPKTGVLDANISSPEVAYGGGVVKGFISWLGGNAPDVYAIHPLGEEGTKQGFGERAGGRLRVKEHGRNATLRTGSDVLHFMGTKDGKEVFTKAVLLHPYFPGPRKMEEALDEMQGEIRSGLYEAVLGVQADLRKSSY
jgi:hypothetical protein